MKGSIKGHLAEKNGKFHMFISYYDQDGKRRQKWQTTGLPIKNNKRRAEQMLSDLIAEYTRQEFIEPSNTLLCDYLTDWVKASKHRVQPTTYGVYEHMLEKHIYPYFKHTGVEMSKLTPATMQKYYNGKLAEGLSPNTVIKHHGLLRSALQQAFETKLIKENPCDLADKPKRTKYRGEFYNADEINALLAVAKGEPIESPIYLAAYFGLRRSEIIGLRWNAIDFTSQTLTVRHKVTTAKKDGKMTLYATDDLKTESSYRVLPLEETLIRYLNNLKQRQDENRKRNGNCHIHDYNDYICVNELGGLINPDYVTDKFGKILKQNGLKHIRFHDLRHSCASLLLALGYSMKEVQEWLGHSNYQTTANLYSHIDPQNKKNMIRGLATTLSI